MKLDNYQDNIIILSIIQWIENWNGNKIIGIIS
jgi:hypothetical protein